MALKISKLHRDEEDAWDEYVYRHPDSTFYHQIGWKNAVENTYRHRAMYLVGKESDEIRGILPMFLMKSQLFDTKLVSIPFASYGGVCADNRRIENQLIEEAKKLTYEYNADYLELRYSTENDINLPEFNGYMTFVLELQEDYDTVWQRLNKKVRNATRKALKTDLRVEVEYNNLDGFYSVYTKNLRYLGTPPHKKTFFKNIMLEFPENTRISAVKKDADIVAMMFLLMFRSTVISGWAASSRRYLSSNPNNLLYWEVIKNACQRKYRYFDFGRSIKGSGTFRFKNHWGAEHRPLYYYYLSKSGRIRNFTQSSVKRQMFAKVWRKLPYIITYRMGPSIRMNFP